MRRQTTERRRSCLCIQTGVARCAQQREMTKYKIEIEITVQIDGSCFIDFSKAGIGIETIGDYEKSGAFVFKTDEVTDKLLSAVRAAYSAGMREGVRMAVEDMTKTLGMPITQISRTIKLTDYRAGQHQAPKVSHKALK